MFSKKFLAILPEDIEEGVILSDVFDKPYLVIFLAKDGNKVFLNKIDYIKDKSEETIFRNPSGSFRLEVYSVKGNLLEAFNFNLSLNKFYDAIVIPNYLNIGEIRLITENKIIDNLKYLEICNENNVCEAGEENLCPLDCASANNPNYPLTSSEKGISIPYQKIEEKVKTQKEIKKLEEVSPTLVPEQSFFYISLIAIAVFLILFIFGIIIYLKLKK